AGFLAWGVPDPASRVIVVADAHLGQVPPAVVTAFHRFLDAVPDLGDALLINGDLFDFWYEYRAVIPRRHFGTMVKLQSLRARDVPVTLVGGNHDRWGGDFLTKHLGLAFYADEAEIDVAGRRAFVARADIAQALYAEQLLAQRPNLHLVILAHTHRTALAELPNGRAYLNPGAFLDGGRYAVVTKTNVELKTFH